LLRIIKLNHIIHRGLGQPPISLNLNLAHRSLQADRLTFSLIEKKKRQRLNSFFQNYGLPSPVDLLITNDHRLLRELPGYRILFDPHALVSQSQASVA